MMEVWVCTTSVVSASEESPEKLQEVHDILDIEYATGVLFSRLWDRLQKKAKIHDQLVQKGLLQPDGTRFRVSGLPLPPMPPPVRRLGGPPTLIFDAARPASSASGSTQPDPGGSQPQTETTTWQNHDPLPSGRIPEVIYGPDGQILGRLLTAQEYYFNRNPGKTMADFDRLIAQGDVEYEMKRSRNS
jgi:hypothetical protein